MYHLYFTIVPNNPCIWKDIRRMEYDYIDILYAHFCHTFGHPECHNFKLGIITVDVLGHNLLFPTAVADIRRIFIGKGATIRNWKAKECWLASFQIGGNEFFAGNYANESSDLF